MLEEDLVSEREDIESNHFLLVFAIPIERKRRKQSSFSHQWNKRVICSAAGNYSHHDQCLCLNLTLDTWFPLLPHRVNSRHCYFHLE